MTPTHKTNEQTLHRLIARSWADAAFKARLLTDPVAVLREEEIDVPAGIQLRAVEDTAQVVHWIIPPRPTELSDEALETMAGGWNVVNFPIPQPQPPRPDMSQFPPILRSLMGF